MKISHLFLFASLASTQNAFAKVDVEELLIDQCSSCHGTEVYTRDNRRVSNLMELEKQLHRCNHVISEKMSPQTVTEVMDYLNKQYYKFKQ